MTTKHAADNDSLLNNALELYAAGYTPIRAATDGTKRPVGNWKQYQTNRPAENDIIDWFSNGHRGIGIVTGHISGNLEVLEFEGRARNEGVIDQWKEIMDASGLDELRARLRGWVEESPSGGLHIHYRIADSAVPGNTKLACRPSTEAELDEWKTTERVKAEKIEDPEQRARRLAKIDTTTGEQVPQTLVETRGEGGFIVTAPSDGTTHPTGKPWTRALGGPNTAPTLTADEHTALHDICRMLDQTPEPEPAAIPASGKKAGHSGDDRERPGDTYNQTATWDDILKPHGWTVQHQHGQVRYWRRPGKTFGISATTGRNEADNLYVFSSSTEFDTETPYSKFGAYALLEHGGDHSVAAKDLYAKQHPTPAPPKPHTAAKTDDTPSTPAPATENATDDPGDPTPPETDDTPTARGRHYTRTDDGNALRLVDTYHDTIRFCPQRGAWLRWNGHQWQWDDAEHVRELARDIARDLPQVGDADYKHWKASLSNSAVTSMVRLARTDERVVAHLAKLDAKPYELNTPAGIVDLRTGQLRPPEPAALHTRATTVAPDFDTPPTRWLEFLATTFAGDPDLTTYIQRLLGQSLIGTVLEQVLPFAFGAGANGKTTLLGAIQRIVGIGDTGYSISAPAEMLLATHQQRHETEIARLSGARLVVTSELEDGQRFAESKVKQFTGRDVITGRFMHKDFFSFVPTHSLWLLANHQPAVRAGGPAFWRRIRLLPFLHTVPEGERDPDLENNLVDHEGPAILAWLIQGAVDYLAADLAEPASVRAATESYERDQDTVARFVNECCDVGDPNAQMMNVQVSAFRSAYETWCRAEGEEPVTAKSLTMTLRARYGVINERLGSGSNTRRMYRGIRLDDTEEAPSDVPQQLPTDPSHEPPDEQSDPWWNK